jgi:uncharacterized membrane protein
MADLTEYDKEQEKKAEGIIRQCNFGSDTFRKAFVRAMLNEHRSLQYDFFTMICLTLHGFADTKHFDGRNEIAVKLSREIIANNPRI